MSKEYVGYVKPRPNLPVNPNPDFYRSASNAAAIRAKEIENQERKTMSLPAGTNMNNVWKRLLCRTVLHFINLSSTWLHYGSICK